MIVAVSNFVVLVVGIMICILALWGIYSPQELTRWTTGVMEKDGAIYVVVIVRLLVGLALIFVAQDSRFPLGFQILGWVAIAAAVAAGVRGRERLRRFANWSNKGSNRFS